MSKSLTIIVKEWILFLPVSSFWRSWYNTDTMRFGLKGAIFTFVTLNLTVFRDIRPQCSYQVSIILITVKERKAPITIFFTTLEMGALVPSVLSSHSQNSFSLSCSLSFSLYIFLNWFWHSQECGRFCSTAINRERAASDVWNGPSSQKFAGFQ